MSAFMFEVGKTYKTQSGKNVTVVKRVEDYRGYECVLGDDNKHRYDRSTSSVDAGRVTGTDHGYSCPDNFARDDAEFIQEYRSAALPAEEGGKS